MSRIQQLGHERRRQIYDYVERRGAVESITVRQNVLIRPQSSSKPARSGPDLDPSVPMPFDEFDQHVSTLKEDGYLEEHEGKLRVALPMATDPTTVELDTDTDSDEAEGEGDATEGVVRPARQEDIGGIVGVVETVAADEGYVVARRLARTVDRDDVLVRHNERENRVFFVATVDDEAVGWLHVEAVHAPMMDHTAELTVGILEAYRDNGLGSTLMDRGLDWAREQGYQKVYQNLPATNERAIEFLEDEGWAVESTRKGHYCVDGELVDEVQLAIWLDE
ncbi:GNAT family N-acetyltransferase [Haloarchaeobius sp. DFWS5]|uniref:GNAT family N-acetyltransferase n=1 Tax=Haloarchaeobius sp. DFWS5 TaxID=3446114 RepID=UPI003EB78E3F